MSKRCADSCGYSRKELGKVLAGEEAKAQRGGEKGYMLQTGLIAQRCVHRFCRAKCFRQVQLQTEAQSPLHSTWLLGIGYW